MLNWFLHGLWDDAITLTPEEKKQVKFGVVGRHAMRKSPWLLAIPIFLLNVPYLLFEFWRSTHTYFSTLEQCLYQAAFITLAFLLFFWCRRRVYAKHARRAIRDLGYDICPHCGYWLRELPPIIEKPFCPECGRVREKLPDSPHHTPRIITSDRTKKTISASPTQQTIGTEDPSATPDQSASEKAEPQ